MQAGQACQVSVQLAAQGNENGVEFSVQFPPTTFSYVSAGVGANAPGASLILNTNNVAAGSLGVVLALPSGSTFAASNDQVLTLTFNVAAAASGNGSISFGTLPLPMEMSDVTANLISSSYVPGTLTITPITKPTMSPLKAQAGAPVFSWPASAAGFVLQSTSSLNPPHWTNAVANLVTNGGMVTATGTTNHPQIFYRLSHP